tara:strand:- start:498 stop:650 length:153 start_codon:yes stop_codon:yes gene_type:complete
MGNWLIKIGYAIVAFSWASKCKYNRLLSKLMFDISKCPIDSCICKKEIKI